MQIRPRNTNGIYYEVERDRNNFNTVPFHQADR